MGETNQRYTQLSKNTDIYILGDAPLVLLGRALLYDTKEDKVIGQLKFQSISEKTIIAFKISVIGFDVSNVQIEQSEFQYLDLKMKENDVTGSQTPIVFGNKNVRKFVFWISEMVYEDGNIENPSNHELILVEKKLISDVLDKELAEQYKRSLNCELSNECGTYIPTSYNKRAWICSCGKINGIHREKCYRCESGLSNEVKLLNKEYLEGQLEEYKKEKELESIEKAKIRKKQIKQLKIGAGTAGVLVAVLLTGSLTYKKIIIPRKQYEEAGKLMEQEHYRGAMLMYEKLGKYKDAIEQAKKAQILYERDQRYYRALTDYKNQNGSAALTVFESLEGYKDSDYYIGMIRFDQSAYKPAIEYFDKVSSDSIHYKESMENKEMCYYNLSLYQLSVGNLEKAKELLSNANGVSDSDEILDVIEQEINKGWRGTYFCKEDKKLSLEILAIISPNTLKVEYKISFKENDESRRTRTGIEESKNCISAIDWDQTEDRLYISGDTITETYRLEGESWDDTELDNGRTHTYVKESDNS